jgi:ABC-type transporter Mla subunit MlaD
VVTSLHDLTTELSQEGSAILGSLDGVDRLIGSVGRLFRNLNEHSLDADIADAASLTRLLARHTDTVAELITGFAQAFETFARISQNGNWINVYACNVFVKTYGKVNITLNQILGSLELPIHLPGGDHQYNVPLDLPNGRVGGAPAHSAVCS